MIKSVFQLLRPLQWIKNLFVFLPAFFSRHILEVEYIIPCVYVFIAFSFCASSIYCLNDIFDIASDRLHNEKKKRPIAAGIVPIPLGWLMVVMCIIVACLIIRYAPIDNRLIVWYIMLFYYVLNIAYCIKLKHVMIVDVFVIALGFVLRVLVGGFSININVSHWIILMTFLLALFLGFAKRRDDVAHYSTKIMQGTVVRNNLNAYNLDFMNQVIGVISSVTIVCYIMYTVSSEVMERVGSNYLYVTSIFVLSAIIRYLQITIVDVKSGSPTKVILHDRFLQGCLLCWGVSFFIILYL